MPALSHGGGHSGDDHRRGSRCTHTLSRNAYDTHVVKQRQGALYRRDMERETVTLPFGSAVSSGSCLSRVELGRLTQRPPMLRPNPIVPDNHRLGGRRSVV